MPLRHSEANLKQKNRRFLVENLGYGVQLVPSRLQKSDLAWLQAWLMGIITKTCAINNVHRSSQNMCLQTYILLVTNRRHNYFLQLRKLVVLLQHIQDEYNMVTSLKTAALFD